MATSDESPGTGVTPMSERPASTNGRVRVENAVNDARATMQARKRGGLRPRKLVVPVLLALGVIYILRRFEDSASG